MPEIPNVDFDENGFMTDPGVWNEEVAKAIAIDLGVGELKEDHWNVLRYVREHHLAYQTIPAMEQVCSHFHLAKDCVRHLFKGPLELWKVAGLPFPGLEAFTYMENEE